jgi:ring-1,2-phenylacetyl-CoA epoxidase subunit PaaD
VTVREASAVLDADAVVRALQDVDDPELPISIVDLGLVESVDVDGEDVRVRLLPTFSGCPALAHIGEHARRRLHELTGGNVEVTWSHAGRWTPDRIAPHAQGSLAEYGVGCIAAAAFTAPCPSCASPATERVSRFGSSLCRSSFRCTACGSRFEALKSPGAAHGAPA